MVVIKHEAPDLRRHVRTQAPVEVQIKDMLYCVTDWSLGGVRIDDFLVETTQVGDRVAAKFTVRCHGLEVSFTKEIEVVRLFGDVGMAARFLDLNPREREVLEMAGRQESKNGEVPGPPGVPPPMTPTSSLPTAGEAPLPNRWGLALRRVFFTL